MIKITAALRDYIERLHFESVRYNDLLQTVSRETCPMTDEEWSSSFMYFKEKQCEALACFSFAMNELRELYCEQIGDSPFYVDFKECAIVLGIAPTHSPYKGKPESFSEYMHRLYPECESGVLRINGTHCKDITFQVTDDCNMACTYCYQHDKGHHTMPFETGKHFIDMFLDDDVRIKNYISSSGSNGFIINFIGGEPWLAVDTISRLSDYLIGELFRRKHPNAIKFCLSVCSNGLLHFDERVQIYLKRHKGHLSYNVSIDGNEALHDACRVDHNGMGTYNRAIAAVRQWRNEMGGYMGSKLTIAPANVARLCEAVMAMIHEGWHHINLNCVYEEGWTNAHARELYWQLHYLTDQIFAE